MANRRIGWIQDAGSFDKLKNILKAMDVGSDYNNELKKRLDIYVPERYGRIELIKALDNKIFNYNDLAGRGKECQLTIEENVRLFSYTEEAAKKIVLKAGRGNAACTGIAQLCCEAQKVLPNGMKKPYQGNWQLDGFLNLGIVLGFITYNAKDDTCILSERGKIFSKTIDKSNEEKEILGDALLSYPPACRVLEIIKELEHATKFEIGDKLGFKGEPGFTSIPQNIYIQGYLSAKTNAERTEIRSNTEGTSDKYARMIAKWLERIGWVSRIPKEIITELKEPVKIGQSYKLTLDGFNAMKAISGISKIAKKDKIVYWEMLANKGSDIDYLRNRRAYIIKCLNNEKDVYAIQSYLKTNGIDEDIENIVDDIENLKNIGLRIQLNNDKYKLKDTIVNLEIPSIKTTGKSNILIEKDRIRKQLHNIDHKYLVLLDYAFDPKKNREFEIETMSLLTEELEFKGTHLGGGSKPDGVFYYNEDGAIVDTKAYSEGYSMQIKQADEMIRYIEENKTRGNINKNEWWNAFEEQVINCRYLFVSSKFIAGFKDRMKYITQRTSYNGSVISAENLLYLAEEIKSGNMSYKDTFTLLDGNKEIIMS